VAEPRLYAFTADHDTLPILWRGFNYTICMNWNAVPVTIMAGIAGYAAILFAGLYFALAKTTDESTRREYLTFALTCVSAVGYEATVVMLYNATTF
jgi:hypothetical protein